MMLPRPIRPVVALRLFLPAALLLLLAGWTRNDASAAACDQPPVPILHQHPSDFDPARTWHGVVYDPVRDRLFIFGGNDEHLGPTNTVLFLPLAGEQSWTPLAAGGPGPVSGGGRASIYDPVRDRVIVHEGTVRALNLSGTPTWEILTSARPPAAPAGLGQSAIYDPVGDRMILFGGQGSSYNNEVWALPLSGSPVWVKLSPTGTAPSPRYLHTAVYDPARHRMLVFGGISDTYNGNLWSLDLTDPPVWSQITPGGVTAPGRYYHVAVFDPAGDRMIVSGGIAGPGGPARDCWALSFDPVPAWTRLADAPHGHYQDAAAYDSSRRRMIIQSGWDQSYDYTDVTCALDLAGATGWTRLSVPRPGPRLGAAGLYDAARHRLVFTGGDTLTGYAGDLWQVDFSAESLDWTTWPWLDTCPSPRWAASAVHDEVNDRLLLFGGGDGSGLMNDLWSLDLAGGPAWTQLSPARDPPSPRLGHAAIFDPLSQSMWICGGYTGGFSREVYQLVIDPLEWRELSPLRSGPSARVGQSAVRDSRRGRMLVFGGLAGGVTPQNDVYALSLTDPPVWSRLEPTGTLPPARGWHAAAYDPFCDAMLVFGGTTDYTTARGDFWVLHLDGTPAWEEVTLADPPPPRFQAVAAFALDRGSMILWGGKGLPGEEASDAWEISWPGIAGAPLPSTPAVTSLRLLPAWPNPMQDRTTIAFELPRDGAVSLGIFDVAGRSIATLLDGRRLGAGRHEQAWDGRNTRGQPVPGGLYFFRIEKDGEVATGRVVRGR